MGAAGGRGVCCRSRLDRASSSELAPALAAEPRRRSIGLGFSEIRGACVCCEGLRIRVAAAETSGILGLWSLTPRLAGALGRQDQWTPLHVAAFKGHVEAAKVLVEAKADVDAGDKVSTHQLSWFIR